MNRYCDSIIEEPRSTFKRWFKDSGIGKLWNRTEKKWKPETNATTVEFLATAYTSSMKKQFLPEVPASVSFLTSNAIDDTDDISVCTVDTLLTLTLSESLKEQCTVTSHDTKREASNHGNFETQVISDRDTLQYDQVISTSYNGFQLKTKTKVHKKRRVGNHGEQDVVNILQAYVHNQSCVRSAMSVERFAKTYSVMKSTLDRWLKESGLKQLQQKLGGWNKVSGLAVVQTCEKWLAPKLDFLRKHSISNSERKRLLTNEEEKYLLNAAMILGNMTLGLSKKDIMDLIQYVINRRRNDNEDRLIPSAKLLHSIQSRHSIKLKLRDPKGLDPNRAKQASDEVRKCFFGEFENHIKDLFNMGRIPWSSPTEIPAECIYNMDEVGMDLIKHTNKVFVPKQGVLHDGTLQTDQAFIHTPEGDNRMNRHITLCITSCANGYYQYPKTKQLCGAPPPFIIHEISTSKTKDALNNVNRETKRQIVPTNMKNDYKAKLNKEIFIPSRYLEGFDEYSDDKTKVQNPCGFNVRTSSKNGSMTKDLFFDFTAHFIAGIKKQSELMNIGPNKRPVFLFLDGHGSRWDVSSILMLLDNNIYAYYLPSKTSIWSQPNDNGVNYCLHKKLELAASTFRRTTKTATLAYHNNVIKLGWESFLKQELDDLLNTNVNCTKSVFQKTGIFPFNPNNLSWSSAIATLGQTNPVNNEQLRYLVKLKEDLALNLKKLSLTERALFPKLFNDERDIFIGAQMIARNLLHRLSLLDENEVHLYCPLQNVTLTEAETVALRFVEIIPVCRKSAPTADQTKSEFLGDANYAKTIIDHTSFFKQISITYYCKDSENDGCEIYDGCACRIDETNWVAIVSNESLKKVKQINCTTSDLLDASKFCVKIPHTDSVTALKKSKWRRDRRYAAQNRKNMQAEADKMLIAAGIEQDRVVFERRVLHDWGATNVTFEDFQALLIELRHPLKGSFDIMNHKSREIETVESIHRRDGLGDIASVSVLVRDALSDFLSSRKMSSNVTSSDRDKAVKRVPSKTVVATKCGANSLDAVAKLIQGDLESAKSGALSRIEKLEKDSKVLEEQVNIFKRRMQDQPDSFWMTAGNETSKECDLFLRLFFPDSGILGKKVAEKRKFLSDNSYAITKFSIQARVEEKENAVDEMRKQIVEERLTLIRLGEISDDDSNGLPDDE